jgi:Zn-dependent metalloprotease
VLDKDPQAADFKDLYKGRQDNGGVHINSGIPKRAFYLAATAMGGFAWEKAGRTYVQSVAIVCLGEVGLTRLSVRQPKIAVNAPP